MQVSLGRRSLMSPYPSRSPSPPATSTNPQCLTWWEGAARQERHAKATRWEYTFAGVVDLQGPAWSHVPCGYYVLESRNPSGGGARGTSLACSSERSRVKLLRVVCRAEHTTPVFGPKKHIPRAQLRREAWPSDQSPAGISLKQAWGSNVTGYTH